jgi:hypothetical protein
MLTAGLAVRMAWVIPAALAALGIAAPLAILARTTMNLAAAAAAARQVAAQVGTGAMAGTIRALAALAGLR